MISSARKALGKHLQGAKVETQVQTGSDETRSVLYLQFAGEDALNLKIEGHFTVTDDSQPTRSP